MAEKAITDLQQMTETGCRLMQEGKPEKAREVFHQVLAHLPDGRLRAKLSYRGKQSQLVIARVAKSLEPLSPSENLGLETRLALARCCFDCGQIEESISHLERVLEVCPDRADAYCRLGQAYSKCGRPALAVSALRRALRLDPALSQAYHTLAQHYVKQERIQDAERALRKAIRLSPDCFEYYLGLAGLFIQQGHVGKALQWLHQSAHRFPTAPLIHETLAELYQRIGDCNAMQAEAETLIRLRPKNPCGYDLLATAYFRNGDIDRAIEILGRLVRLDPMDPVSRLKRALLFQQNGEFISAMDEYQWVFTLADSAEIAQAAQDAMESLDHFQTQQILLRAAEDTDFRTQLTIDTDIALLTHGYRLTEYALEALRRMDFDAELTAPEEWQIVYH
jgi:tetratricopeptide (TPR) repeat protein